MSVYRSDEGESAVKAAYHEILSTWPHAHDEIYIETRHGRTFVVACGDPASAPIVLLHGSGSNAVSWFGDMPLLAEHYRVFAVDMIGEPGLSDANRLPWSDPGYLEWLDDVLDGLGVTVAGLVGMSLGGWLALTYASARPERVNNLVLIAPGGLAPARLSFMLKALGCMLLGSWGRSRLERLVGWDSGILNDSADAETKAQTETMMAFIRLINANFVFHRAPLPLLDEARLRELKMPLLMFFGDRDALLNAPASCALISKAVPQAEVRVLPDTGHVILNRTEEVIEHLTAAN